MDIVHQHVGVSKNHQKSIDISYTQIKGVSYQDNYCDHLVSYMDNVG